jgi:hypothetical protein
MTGRTFVFITCSMIKKIVISPKDSKRVISFLNDLNKKKEEIKRKLEENATNRIARLNKLKH